MAGFMSTRLGRKPPDKGSFPLDHDGECKKEMLRYIICLRKSDHDNNSCRVESKDYLKCRMDNNLMAKEDWKKLGYSDDIKKTEDT
ncbi:uncharacterized protein LOC134724544 [Mytilus trossulus]|uniref:uncharacterized protein LOC134724544 n=1 Tax=Mytilus trossulus TaxID=6551 RepID=UPI0030073651